MDKNCQKLQKILLIGFISLNKNCLLDVFWVCDNIAESRFFCHRSKNDSDFQHIRTNTSEFLEFMNKIVIQNASEIIIFLNWMQSYGVGKKFYFLSIRRDARSNCWTSNSGHTSWNDIVYYSWFFAIMVLTPSTFIK